MFDTLKRRSIIPGFGLTMGFTLFYLCLLVLIPLSVLLLKLTAMTWQQYWEIITDVRVLAAFRVSFTTALFAAVINAVFGLMIAWVLVRYQFLGKKIIDGIVDLPFALPTAVAGISLTAIYAENGWMGALLHKIGFQVAFTQVGITLALVFIGIPYVVRTVQPILHELEKDIEEAAVSLGAYRWRTFHAVIFPELFPALLTGFALAFSRGLGEYGSVVFISGNMPMKTEIVPLLIMTKLEQFDYTGAIAIATTMLVISFLLLLLINYIQWQSTKKTLRH
ncbi:sulfate ABC transporter permease subunit CysT [Desulfuribacillus stibiiarsenatis]|uniref:Sulfate transport system permease protein CysT n=1 Tax=Desulfuribacillus stibiiarsenatis TaxID=1390249 RepID=A0A1E5L7N1_9FIRM|nr:sulfate ABC transporter permease subunit CysT [Desulfuribacillus stibiiarsenatis]OEH85989.1 sulfate ABC transporter permease subunit CysT [Desulfuribacillus stibiiarsenatis]